MPRRDLILPDLAIDATSITASVWLVGRGKRVTAGEPVLEVLAGVVTVDLPSPADGVLAEKLVAEDELLEVGQRLAVIESR